MAQSERPAAGDPLAFLAGDGEMGERIRAFDWPSTPLGPAESWSPALRTVIRLMLANRLPMLLWWGPQYISIYNDPYIPVLGNKHPWGLGQPVKECWREIWHVLQPLIDTPFHGGPATWDEDILLVINRYGFNEETHWLIAYSPVPDERVPSGIGGVLATVHETTDKVLSERRMTALRDLGVRPAEAKTAEVACAVAASTLEAHARDLPFALLYLTDADGNHARLASTAGVAAGQDIGPRVVDLEADGGAWPLAEAKRTMQSQVVTDLAARFGAVPAGPWADPPTAAVVLPIGSGRPHEPAGFLVAGVSSGLRLDDAYLGFLGLVTTQIGTAIANARAYEEETRRVESLAELDRAKTTFFSNVSHEFRTPLTLILGPLEDAIDAAAERPQRDRLLTLQRNALRLQKLVNTLLDFSRIEARRVQVSFQPVDLAALTRELASNFQSACEKAGLELVMDCAPLAEPVYVDIEMWENIVLNLVSNAFKFTFEGGIEVTVRLSGPHAELVVRDTGVGIPADQMPRLFERFHRVEGVTGRTQEGSGIGLALVRELVRLHGGAIDARSVAGQGTVFVVKVPVGTAHIQGQRIVPASALGSMGLRAGHYVEEALHWLPDGDTPGGNATAAAGTLPTELGTGLSVSSERSRILLADDNADMRQYLQRLLSEQYDVEAVTDGLAALEAMRQLRPDLILSDVMMPRLDGFGLLREIRADPELCALPVIFLSARAGEESRVEGMQAVADDYLVKPFGARELLARVSAHLQMARLRRETERTVRESEERFRAFVTASSDVVYRMSADWTEMRFLQGRNLIADTDEPSRAWLENYIDPDDRPRVMRAIGEAIRTRSVFALEHRVVRLDGTLGWTFSRAVPLVDADGAIVEWLGAATDVTARKQAEDAQARLAAIVESSEDAIVSKTLDAVITSWNRGAERLFGYTAAEAVGRSITLIIPPERLNEEPAILERLRRGERVEHFETVRVAKDGRRIDISLTISPVRDSDGRIIGASKIGRDITARKRAEVALREQARLLREVAAAGLTIHSAGSLDDVLRVIAGEARTLLGAHRAIASLTVGDDCTQVTNALSTSGAYERWRESSLPPPVELACAEVCRTNRPMRLTRAELDDHPAWQSARETRDAYPPLRGWMAAPFVSRGGKNLGLIRVSDKDDGDFSESDEAALAQLAHIASVAIENARLYGELRDQDRRKDEFLALLAHELRNPLAPLRNGLQVMRLAGSDAGAMLEARTMMERQLGHMVRLIDDLLDVSRVSRGKMELRRARVLLADVVRSAVETVRPAIEEAGHELTVALSPEPVHLDADLTRLAQVFGNLLSNSAKYTPRGGRIWLDAARRGAEVVVSVRDNGIGIPADSLRSIFGMFSQVDRSIERSTGGLGIGLALVKGLVEMHGGSITAESPGLEAGSTFTVRLPLVDERAEAASATPADEGPRAAGAKRRILVVDDNEDAAKSLAMMLKIMGNDVRTAHDGEAAVAAAAAYRPDMIVLDVGMPKLNGFDACRRIREQPWGKGIFIVALTGWGQDEDKRRSQEAGFNHHLVKPVEPAHLYALLGSFEAATG